MTKDDLTPPPQRPTFIERSVRRIANSRSLVLGLSLTFVGLAFIGAIVIRIADPDNFPSFGSAVWWALQTVTTSVTETSCPRLVWARSSAASKW